MYKRIPNVLWVAISLLVVLGARAGNEVPSTLPGNYVESLQPVMAEQPAWKTFAQSTGWSALFEQRNGLPSRAFGTPLQLKPAASTTLAAEQFLKEQLEAFGASHVRFSLESDNSSDKYQYLKFRQQYNGVQVLYSDIDARLDKQGRLVMFGLDVFDDINISTTPSINEAFIQTLLANKYTGIEETRIDGRVKILPTIKTDGPTTYNLVYKAIVQGDNAEGHFEREIFIDAHSGAIISDKNLICNLDVDIKSAVYNNPLLPKVTRSLPYIKVRYNNVNYFADATGKVTLPDFVGTATVKVYLEGTYAKVIKSNGFVPSYDIVVNSATPLISLDGIATDPELSAYYHVTAQHEFMKTKLPTFTGLDINMVANINLTNSTCNAFYSPVLKEVNFYKEGGGCKNSALFGDVIYHEYGHGINYEYADFLGGNFSNPSLGEGYADVWAFMHTNDPIIANGFGHPDTTPYIRRYDLEPKVYPVDMVGEVHWDGEIIAGAWWDTKENIGNMATMQSIFVESLLAKPDQPAGLEGKLYTQILLDALLADDNDGNISNGTPNALDILDAFDKHGIRLYTSLTVLHTENVAGDSLTPINLAASFSGVYNNAMITAKTMFYKKRGTSTWLSVPASISGANLTATIPGQAAGSIIDYYFKLDFIGGQTLYVPTYVKEAELPEFPFNALVSYSQKLLNDFDASETAGWVAVPGAFTGNWLKAKPVGSKITLNVNYAFSRDVQIGTDNSPSSTNICYITGNATLNDQAGVNDVDSGRTTLRSPIFNVSAYADPVISYYRFYTCDRGANPGTDTFKVYISNNDGLPVLVEQSQLTDWKWRRNVIRLKDHFASPGNIRISFVADDVYSFLLPQGGGSLVEAGVDDVALFDLAAGIPSGLQDPLVETGYTLYPNPASDLVSLGVTEPGVKLISFKIYNSKGDVVMERFSINKQQEDIKLTGLSNGTYFIMFETNKGSSTGRFIKSH